MTYTVKKLLITASRIIDKNRGNNNYKKLRKIQGQRFWFLPFYWRASYSINVGPNSAQYCLQKLKKKESTITKPCIIGELKSWLHSFQSYNIFLSFWSNILSVFLLMRLSEVHHDLRVDISSTYCVPWKKYLYDNRILIDQAAAWFQSGSCLINQAAAWFYHGGCLIDQVGAWFWSGNSLINQAAAWFWSGSCLTIRQPPDY